MGEVPRFEIRDIGGTVIGYVYDCSVPPEVPEPPTNEDYPLPEPPAGAKRVLVQDTAALKAAVNNAAPGDVILLGKGKSFGDLGQIDNKKWSPGIWIMSEDREARAKVTTAFAKFSNCQGITFADIDFVSAIADAKTEAGKPVHQGTCLEASGCSDFAVQNCLFDRYMFQIAWRHMKNVRLQWNTHYRVAQDAIRLFETCENVTIDNILSGPHEPPDDQEWIDSHHLDHVQFACNGTYPGAVNVKVRNSSFFVNKPNLYCQGVVWFNGWIKSHPEDWPISQHRDLLVEDCYFEMSHVNTVALQGTERAVVRRNVMRKTAGSSGTSYTPTVNIYRNGHINEALDVSENAVAGPVNLQPPAPASGPDYTGTIEDNALSDTPGVIPSTWKQPPCGQFGWAGGVLFSELPNDELPVVDEPSVNEPSDDWPAVELEEI